MALRLEYGYHLWNNIDIDSNNQILVYSSVIALRYYLHRQNLVHT